MSDFFRGFNCTAQRLEVDKALDPHEFSLTWWLLTGQWHPLWPQFILSVVRLKEVEGTEPPKLHFEGATHELLVAALNPGEGRTPKHYSAAQLNAGGLTVTEGFLHPIDVVHQFTATDEEMFEIATQCAQAVVNGVLNPSVDDNRTYYREQWLQAIVKTLAHMRGEEHAP